MILLPLVSGPLSLTSGTLPDTVQEKTRAYLFLHSAVLLFGLTGIFGKLIHLPQVTIVWYRILLTVLSLLFFPGLFRNLLSLPRKTVLSLACIGVIVALHWALFFGAIQLTNVSITMVCLATGSFFTAILEPVLLRTRVKVYQLLLGLLVVPGIWLIAENSDDNGNLHLGIIVGLLSAFFSSVFGVLNKRMVPHYDSVSITFIELGSGWVVISLFLPFWYTMHPADNFVPSLAHWTDWIWISALAFLCTTYAYQATLKALRVLSPFVISLSINLEPVYSIIIAFFLFREHEELQAGFYFGAAIILLSVFVHPLIEKRLQRKIIEE